MTKPFVDLDAVVLELWAKTSGGDLFASKALAEAFARKPAFGDHQREVIADTLYGMLSHARRIDHALSPDGTDLPQETSRPLAQLIAYRLLETGLPVSAAQKRLPEIDWSGVVAADKALAGESDPIKRIAIGASLPDFLAERLLAEYGGEAEAMARALTQRAPMMLRVNTIKASRQKVLGTLAKAGLNARPAAFADTGVELETRVNVFRLPQFEAGHVELQDEASQLATGLVAPPPKGLVVDFCAGAGGKTLALGALMKNTGRLIALDVNRNRIEELRRRGRRAGLANTRAILLDKQGEWPEFVQGLVGKADRVLVDVPCSGIGAFRRKPEMRWRLKEEGLRRLPEQQLAIGRQAMRLCAPGGRLIYATCTVLAEENERVVEALLSDGEFERVPVKEILGKAVAEPIADSTGTFLKLLPHRHRCDGFFAAVLRRKRR